MNTYFTIAGISPESGGPSRCVPSLAEGLACHGVDVQLLTLYSDLEDLKCKQSCRYSICGYETNGSMVGNIIAVKKLRSELRCQLNVNNGQSLIHDNGIWLGINHAAASVAAKT